MYYVWDMRQFLVEACNESDHFGDVDKYGMIIIKRTVEKQTGHKVTFMKMSPTEARFYILTRIVIPNC